MVLKRPQRNYTLCKLSIWPINKVLLLLLVEFNTHWLCVEKSWFYSVWYSLKTSKQLCCSPFVNLMLVHSLNNEKICVTLSVEFKYKSDISNRCFILQFQRPETRVNLANAHTIDINDKKERDMLRAFTAPLANLKLTKWRQKVSSNLSRTNVEFKCKEDHRS